MRSRAHIKTHPLHPILIAFPIAFFTGTLAFDILAVARDNESFYATAVYLLIAGIGSALIAAIPGLIDYIYTVPPDSSAKKRATQHAILNLSMVALFAFSLIHRLTAEDPSEVLYLLVEGAGIGLMLTAGWMGGTLVHRNQIGVDPRYAFSGKWQEEYLTEVNGQVKVDQIDSLKRDQMKLIHVSGKRIVVARSESGYVAFDDRCTHKGGSLAGGMMICGTVQCPWHGSQFDVATGAVKAGPAEEKIRCYETQMEGNTLWINISR